MDYTPKKEEEEKSCGREPSVTDIKEVRGGKWGSRYHNSLLYIYMKFQMIKKNYN